MDTPVGRHAPDTITITEHQLQDLRATGADLRCTCSTHRRLGTPAAIRAIQAGLEREGFPGGSLTVQNITHASDFGGCLGAVIVAALVAAGLFAWLSPANLLIAFPVIGGAAASLALIAWFAVRSTQHAFVIRCKNSEEVERALAVLARVGEGVAVNATDWRYEIDSNALNDWAVQCIQRANARAERVAEALGVTIVGVHAYEESHVLPSRASTGPESPGAEVEEAKLAAPKRRASAAGGPPSAPPGPLAGSERGGAHVTVRYRVTGYAPRAPARPTDETPPEVEQGQPQEA